MMIISVHLVCRVAWEALFRLPSMKVKLHISHSTRLMRGFRCIRSQLSPKLFFSDICNLLRYYAHTVLSSTFFNIAAIIYESRTKQLPVRETAPYPNGFS